MRFYPTSDVCHYWEFPSQWTFYRSNPNQSWYRKPFEDKHTINYWSDLEAAKLPVIKKTDLYFKNWPHSRIRPQACLPLLYCMGNRFIRLERDGPVGCKCMPLPMNLKEMRELKEFEKRFAKFKREQTKQKALLDNEKKKLEMKKKGVKVK